MNIIIGAGISGLSFANFTGSKDFIILEKEKEPGGYCKTINKNGFIWDYSGHFFHFRNRSIERFLINRMATTQIKHVIKKSQIKYKADFIDFPFQKNIHQLQKEEFIDCLYDLFIKTEKKNYSSFKDMLFGKFGKAISEKFLIPYNEKLYACNLDNLDEDAMGRFFPYAKIEEIVKNMKTKSCESYNDAFAYPEKGAIQYINGLLMDIPEKKIRYNEELIKIDTKNKIAYSKSDEYRYDNLISTMPFPLLLEACGVHYNKSIYSSNKVLVFNFGFDKKGKDKLNHWIYFPEKDYVFYRVGYYDNILTTNKMSLYVEIGFDKDEIIHIKNVREKVLSDLKRAQIITDHILIAEHHIILDPAYVHVKNEANRDKEEKKEHLRKKGVFSIGRYGDWKYCSIEDNIIEAKNLANEIK